jgi:hypothetical protein
VRGQQSSSSHRYCDARPRSAPNRIENSVGPSGGVKITLSVDDVPQQGEITQGKRDRAGCIVHLVGALKAYEGLPEEPAMVAKLGLITQLI